LNNNENIDRDSVENTNKMNNTNKNDYPLNNISNRGTESFATKPGIPFTRVGLDIIGPLPITKSNNKYIIVLVDYFTKWVEAEPFPTIESKDVKFLTNVFSRHGIP